MAHFYTEQKTKGALYTREKTTGAIHLEYKIAGTLHPELWTLSCDFVDHFLLKH